MPTEDWRDVPCKLWTGHTLKGYGYRRVNGRAFRVHRLAYEEAYGPIPEGLEIDHLCRVRACYEPRHLEAVTHQENVRRATALITHCPQGHEYTDENSRYRERRGGVWRSCWICRREKRRTYRARRRADRGR